MLTMNLSVTYSDLHANLCPKKDSMNIFPAKSFTKESFALSLSWYMIFQISSQHSHFNSVFIFPKNTFKFATSCFHPTLANLNSVHPRLSLTDKSSIKNLTSILFLNTIVWNLISKNTVSLFLSSRTMIRPSNKNWKVI